MNLAWPNAEIAVMGPGRRGKHHQPQGDRRGGDDPEAKRAELIADYRERFANPYVAANRGYLDDVIDPAETRPVIVRALRMLANKVDSSPPKKHGNIPL